MLTRLPSPRAISNWEKKKNNDESVMKIGETRTGGNRRRSKQNKKRREVDREDKRECGIDESVVKDREGGEERCERLNPIA